MFSSRIVWMDPIIYKIVKGYSLQTFYNKTELNF